MRAFLFLVDYNSFMLSRILNLTVLISLLLSSSCASMLSGTTETLYIRSDVPGTKLFYNKTEIGTDEAKVWVSKKRLKGAKLIAIKEGCQPTTVPIETQFDKTSLWGLIIDLGLVSILIIDWGIYGSVREAKKLNYILSPVCPGPAI